MRRLRSWHWCALVVAFGLTVSASHAEIITPDSIPNPPSAVSSANGTAVYDSNLVNSQYAKMGLNFGNSWTAITHLSGMPVWAPVNLPFPTPGSSGGTINYYSQWNGGYLSTLTTGTHMTVSSLTVATVENSGQLSLTVFGLNLHPLNITPIIRSVPGVDGEKLWTFTGSGIYGFSAVLTPPPVVSGVLPAVNPAWGVASVSFTPSGQTPEPSSLVLGGLGALGFVARLGWRRRRVWSRKCSF